MVNNCGEQPISISNREFNREYLHPSISPCDVYYYSWKWQRPSDDSRLLHNQVISPVSSIQLPVYHIVLYSTCILLEVCDIFIHLWCQTIVIHIFDATLLLYFDSFIICFISNKTEHLLLKSAAVSHLLD